MTTNINIDYDEKLAKFIISCPMWANDALMGIDPKRWSKPRRAWMAPVIRKNVEAIKALGSMSSVSATATKAIAEYDNKIKEMTAKSGGFPIWYKYKTKPRDHQLRCYDKAYGKKAFAMHMDRGTGKSKATIDLGCALRMNGDIGAMVILCKATLRKNWLGYDKGDGPNMKEGFLGHSPLHPDDDDIFLFESGMEKQYLRWSSIRREFPILIVGIESLSQGKAFNTVMDFVTKNLKVMTVIDESHMIANHKAIRSEKAYSIGRASEYRMTLTGTPTMTGPLDLFMQFEFLDPNIIGIGDFYAYRNRYATMGGYRDPRTGKPLEIVGYQHLDELSELIAPYVFECTKDEVLDLPPKVYEVRTIELTPEQRALYKQIKKEESYEWNGQGQDIQNTLELALRLHQVCGGYISTKHEEERTLKNGQTRIKKVSEWHPIIPPDKNPKIKEILDIASENKQMIIWCAYIAEIEGVIEALRNEYPDKLIRPFHGAVTDAEREQYKSEFQDGRCFALVGNTSTGGTGHTLTACETMVFYNNSERMVDRLQAEDRAHRDGLNHSVLYIDLVADKAVDGTILKSIDAKMDLAEFLRKNIRNASDKAELLGTL